MYVLKAKGIASQGSKESHLFTQCNPLTHRISANPINDLSENKFIVNKNGSFDVIVEHQFTAKNVTWNSEEVCFSHHKWGTFLLSCIEVSHDLDKACKSRLCLPLCCGKNDVIANPQDAKNCQKPVDSINPRWFNVSVSNDDGDLFPIENLKGKESPYYVVHPLKSQCGDEFEYIDPDEDSLIYENITDGYFLRLETGLIRTIDHCIAQYGNKSDTRSLKIRKCKNLEWSEVLHKIVGPLLSAISALFLTIALVIVWNKERFKVHGALKLLLLLSYLFFFLLISLKPLFDSISYHNPKFCTFIAYATQYAYNSIMCWVGVLAFDVWKKFSKIERPESTLSKKKTLGFFKPKFRNYFLYSLAIPTIITIVTIVLSRVPGDHTKAELNQGWCLFSGHAFILYRFLPSGLIFLIPLIFMALFTHMFCCGLWSTQYVNKGNEVKAAGKIHKFQIVLRAVIVMGVCWMIDLISNVIGKYYPPFSTTNLVWQSLLDPISYLNGVWLFIATTVYKSEIMKMRAMVSRKCKEIKKKGVTENVSDPEPVQMHTMEKDEQTVEDPEKTTQSTTL